MFACIANDLDSAAQQKNSGRYLVGSNPLGLNAGSGGAGSQETLRRKFFNSKRRFQHRFMQALGQVQKNAVVCEGGKVVA